MKRPRILRILMAGAIAGATLAGCEGPTGPAGAAGEPGTPGAPGTPGTPGAPGQNGQNGTVSGTLPEYVRSLVAQLKANPGSEETLGFPLAAASTDSLRTLPGLTTNVVASWLDPLKYDDSNAAPRWGSHGDYIGILGEGWDQGDGWQGGTDTPYFAGNSSRAWMYSNFEYISGNPPFLNTTPTAQSRQFARWLVDRGVLPAGSVDDPTYWTQANVDTYVLWHKRQVGGGFARVVRDGATGQYSLERTSNNVRLDATSSTRIRITGIAGLTPNATDDSGAVLPTGVVAGSLSNCSGGVTPWGTVLSGEENTQDYYGDLDNCYDSNNGWVPGSICAPGQMMAFDTTPTSTGAFGVSSVARNPRDYYGYLVEFDPSASPGTAYDPMTGVGHMKLGSMGRARWENATFAVGENLRLVDGQPIVIYGGEDRRGGRIYKWVSNSNWNSAMTRTETRALLQNGKIYVAHFADLDNATGNTVDGAVPTAATPGSGQWIHLSTSNTTQTAPNAAALGAATTTVGAALGNVTWNSMGGFASDDMVRLALFSASNKIGVRELNRPEDIEWNPFDQTLYVAFTNHNKPNVLNADGTLDTRAASAKSNNKRADGTGTIFAIHEADPDHPGSSATFTFEAVFIGSQSSNIYAAANPDNIMIDHDGGVWFGTDGNYGTNRFADSIYYLDIDTGRPYRVASVPSDAEATGPALSPDGLTLFFNVQHPGEDIYSAYQANAYGPRSSTVAITTRR